MATTEKNDFHYGPWFPLKGIASAKMNDLHQKEWLPLKGMISSTGNMHNCAVLHKYLHFKCKEYSRLSFSF